MQSQQPCKLFNRHFFLLWQGQFVSLIGTQAFSIAMMFWIKHATGSASLMGLLMMASTLPSVLLGPVGGTVADRYSRRTIIILSDLLRGGSVLSLVVLMWIAPEETGLILGWLLAISVLSSIISAFFLPAISAAIPDLVPRDKLESANSLNQFSMQISSLVGQAAGGVLYRLLGTPLLFFIDGATYLFSALSECFISIPRTASEYTESWRTKFATFKTDAAEGFGFVWRRKGMRILFLTAAFLNFFIFPIVVLLPFYVEDFLRASTDWYGFLIAGFSGGSIAGYLVAGTIRLSGKTRSRCIVAALIMECSGFGTLGMIDAPLEAIAVFAALGLLSGFVNINIHTILQLTTPSPIRGRVFGILHTLSNGISPLAMGLTGIIFDLIDQDIALVYAACGLIAGTLALSVSASGTFRRFLAYEDREESASSDPNSG